MKICSIRIKNLASLGGLTEIDFTTEPLHSAGIFAITGPTGAGKSTILDALCLALYAKTPRYVSADRSIDVADVHGSTIKQDDVRGILREGTAEAFAEVDFVAANGEQYRSRWSVRRARGKITGNLQAAEMSLTNLSTGQSLPGRKTELLAEIERLVGLNFDQFTRSVLLAQGDFSAFLKADTNDKAALLEKLTGTQIYSQISIKIYENFKAEKNNLEKLNERRQGIETFSEEELKELNEKKEALSKERSKQEVLVKELTKEKNWHTRLHELISLEKEAKIKAEAATQLKEAAKSRKEHLTQIERVQPARQLQTDLTKAEGLYSEKKLLAGRLHKELSALRTTKEEADREKTEAEDKLKEKEQLQEEARPALDKARTLDIQLEEKNKQQQSALKEARNADKQYQQQEKNLSAEKKLLEGLHKEIEALVKWIEKREGKRLVAENERYIIGKLTDASASFNQFKENDKKLKETLETIHQLSEKHQALSEKVSSTNAQIEEKSPALINLETELKAIPIAEIEQKKQTVDALVEELIESEAHWDKLFTAIGDVEKAAMELETAARKSVEFVHDFANATDLLRQLKAEKDTAYTLLEKAKIAATENVEKLREQLVEEEPCPVCGSTEHPFITENKQLDHVLKTLDDNYLLIESDYSQQLQLHARLEQQTMLWEDTVKRIEQEIPAKKQTLQALKERWSEFQISHATNDIAEEVRKEWLQEQKQQHKSRQDKLSQEIVQYKQLKELLEKESAILRTLESQWNEASNELKDIVRKIKSAEEDKARIEKEKLHARSVLQNIQSDLADYFTAELWFDHWQNNTEQFCQDIKKFAHQWQEQNRQLEEKGRLQSITGARIDEMQKQLEALKSAASDKKQLYDSIASERKAIEDMRKSIFEGKPVAEVEKALKEALLAAGRTAEEKQKEVTGIANEIIKTETQWKQVGNEVSMWQHEVTQLQTQVNGWLSNYNLQYGSLLTGEQLTRLLVFSHGWIETERNELRLIDDEVTNTQSAFAERRKDVGIHVGQRISEKEESEVEQLLTDAQARATDLLKEINQIGFTIEDDKAKRRKIADLLKEIEKQHLVAEDWAKLNELVGSADGKKFRQIAQEYTLDVLLNYANVHLGVLNRRYALQRTPNSLAMQVIDHDMGDEIRTVYSLSGGETFLVSLALALGLASLSSNRIQVETLFIDEGFGSLDSATLAIAMDALERLYNEGRKVGVISHVPEMAERILVQIRVNKEQSGRSRVEVI